MACASSTNATWAQPKARSGSRATVENYFNYFTEIEERFQQRRGGILLLSTLDWALIETWKDAGIPLAAVLRGVDEAFDKYDRRPSKTRKVNSLAYCAQEVLAAAESIKEAATGSDRESADGAEGGDGNPAQSEKPAAGFSPTEIATFLGRCADKIAAKLQLDQLPSSPGISTTAVAAETANSLRELAVSLESPIGSGAEGDGAARSASRPHRATPNFEDLERRLTVMEEKLFAALQTAAPQDVLITIRAEADRELAPYRRKMPSAQVEQLMRQYVHKKLFEKYGLPRLSLFYL